MVLLAAWLAAAQVPSPINLSGAWSLNVHLSDHPEQIALAVAFDTGEFRPESYERSIEGRGRRGSPDSATVPGRRENDGPAAERMSADDRKVLAELVRPVQFPPLTLTVAQANDAVTITAGERAPYVMRTDGKVETQPLDVGSVNRAAMWVGPQLRVTYEVGRAGLLTYTYSLVPATGQLLIRVNFERVRGKPGPFEIKLVYDKTVAQAT
jgi:hypothetical protein